MTKWLIVSFEHCAFWLPRRWGYTRKIEEAGRYSFEEATKICEQANIAQPPDDPHEVMVPAPEAVEEAIATALESSHER